MFRADPSGQLLEEASEQSSMKPNNEIGHIIRGARNILNISADSLCKEIGICRTTLHQVEQGTKKWVRKDTVGKALDLFQQKGVGVYENEEYFIVLVTKQK
jgi:DNA-binding XRE family transcriptional regulator